MGGERMTMGGVGVEAALDVGVASCTVATAARSTAANATKSDAARRGTLRAYHARRAFDERVRRGPGLQAAGEREIDRSRLAVEGLGHRGAVAAVVFHVDDLPVDRDL